MAAVDFLHHDNPPTWAGVEPATLGVADQRQSNYATQSTLAELQGDPSSCSITIVVKPFNRSSVVVERKKLLINFNLEKLLSPLATPIGRVSNILQSIPRFGAISSDEAHFWLNGYVNKQNSRIWSEANPQVYVETPLHPEKLTVWCALWAGGILLQK
ncbi:hypothetical protein TNCV_3364651 [Trichonephila clavipes]|nr:hypothetical protein TNCV_3364651 [Trichonephila clavipes]